MNTEKRRDLRVTPFSATKQLLVTIKPSFNDFFQYACQYSVFDKKDLLYWYNKGGCKIIKFTYNIALKNRLTRHSLIEKVGLDRKEYWGFFKINDSQFDSIVELGGVNRNIIY